MEPRSRFVIINADDMGLHKAINQGIAQGHHQGVVTSVSIVACGEAFEDAVAVLRACPGLGTGAHLTLVEERPVSQASRVRSLIDETERMRPSYKHFARDWCMGLIEKREVEFELRAQVDRLLHHGIRPSHLDSHQHVHCLPGIWGLVLKIARAYQIPFVRMPEFDSLSFEGKTLHVPILRTGINVMSLVRRRLGSSAVKFADCMRGTALSGRMTVSNLLRILDNARSGITEVVVHPGISHESLHTRYRHWDNFNWGSDLQAVTDQRVITRCFKGDITLTNYASLAKSGS